MARRLASLFSDHMVLQRKQPIPVWGWADAGEQVTVRFAGQAAHGIADSDGRWRVTLPPLSAGGPYDLAVEHGPLINDVLVGDVWVCSGQSNMAWPLQASEQGAQAIQEAADPALRLFTVPKVAKTTPQADVSASWRLCLPDSVGTFSAVAYYFGQRLRTELDIPVGLINASFGGTPAEAWLSLDAMRAEPELAGIVRDYDDAMLHIEEALADYRVRYAAWEDANIPKDAGNTGFAQGWADPHTDTSSWPTMALPTLWQNAGLQFNGVVWFRKTITIPPEWAHRPLTLNLGACDKNDITYFDNVQVGSLTMQEQPDAWCTPRRYAIPGELARPGVHVIAVRVFSNLHGGGMTGPVECMCIKPVDAPDSTAIHLGGLWQYQVEQNYGVVAVTAPPLAPWGNGCARTPGSLFNGMIAPLIPFGIRGAIWYQGEANVSRAAQYRMLFPILIRDWRAQWSADIPFYFVQLPNFVPPAKHSPGHWPFLREAQALALALPQTGMAVTIDLGEPHNVHPRKKREVGDRLATNALHLTYGRADIAPSGPRFAGVTMDGAEVRIRFTDIAGGLCCRGELLDGFLLAGADKVFYPADARIEGDTVILTTPIVPAPIAVRYAWTDNPPCTLYNQAGLPAAPFRTDDWAIGAALMPEDDGVTVA